MRLKDDSIQPKDLSPQLLLALMVAKQVYDLQGVELVITSLNDASHASTSLHYSGNAADLRSNTLHDPVSVVHEIKSRLTVDYDVLFEGDHIHIEYQPRRR